jgi:hypothetical protein
MTEINKLMQVDEQKRAESLAALMQISRDLEAYLEGPKELKVRVSPKYERVDGRKGSTSTLDKEYRDNLRAFTPRDLDRVFGQNRNLAGVEREVRSDLQATYGTTGGLETYVDTATQAIMQVAISATQALGSEQAPYLKSAVDFLVKVTTSGASTEEAGISEDYSQGITSALVALNNQGSPRFVIDSAAGGGGVAPSLFQGKVFRYLAPMSFEHLSQLEAKYLPKLQSRDEMLAYIGNAQAQLAAGRYVMKHPPKDNVLVPAAIKGTGEDAAKTAMAQYNKDVLATFEYYKKAVESEYDMTSGVQTGQVEAALSGAAGSLRAAANAVSLTGALPSVISDIKSTFNSVARQISSIKTSNTEKAKYEIVQAYAKIVDALGYDKGDAPDTLLGDLKDNVKTALGIIQAGSGALGFQNEAYEDSLEDIRPSSLSRRELSDIPAVGEFKEYISSALSLLLQAHSQLIGVGLRGIAGAGPTAPALKRPEVTTAFKNLVKEEMADVWAAIKTVADSDQINDTGFKAGIMAAYADIFGIRGTAFDAVDFSGDLITSQKFTQIADGRLPTLSSVSAQGQTIKDRMLSVARTAGGSAKRRATASALVQSVELTLNTLEGLRVQAESIGMRIRQNPAFGRGERVKNALVYGGGSLVGNHAVASGINRFVNPASGSALSYLTTYGSSAATIGYAMTKVDDEETRNDLAIGAGLHIAARAALTYFPGLRFSNSWWAKIIQAPTSGVASVIGDQSLAASGIAPADASKHSDKLGEYVLNLVKTNNLKAIPYIAAQLSMSGLSMASDGGDLVKGDTIGLSVSAQSSRSVVPVIDKDQMEILIAFKQILSVVPDYMTVSSASPNALVIKALSPEELPLVDTIEEFPYSDAEMKTFDEWVTTLPGPGAAPAATTGKFILEPGYNMDAYSGADDASYLQPAPIQTSQSGFAQLENAINRARRLSNREKAQEGLGDMHDTDVIRATPKTARMAEKVGIAVSLGQSRSNPNHELLALQVQGANGLWQVDPARQRSVPQGALNHARIKHAPDIAVSPYGLFNKGVFTPSFGG